jgi:hypothetical protein
MCLSALITLLLWKEIETHSIEKLKNKTSHKTKISRVFTLFWRREMDTKAYLYRQEAMKRWILLFIVSLFSLFVLGIYAIAAERYYDESGRYMGRMDDSGRMYDKSGRYQGRVSEDGRFYDNSGRYQGRQSSDGRYYDKSGRYQGRMTEDGRGYNKQGQYQGRISEDGRMYDKSGRYQGRIQNNN